MVRQETMPTEACGRDYSPHGREEKRKEEMGAMYNIQRYAPLLPPARPPPPKVSTTSENSTPNLGPSI
jgi:hypothetical protein